MAAPRVTITFKQSEMEIVEFLQTKSSPAAYIKDLLKKEMGAPVSYLKAETTTNEATSNNVQAIEKPIEETPRIIDDIEII